ncbi:VPS10 domain-containing receptor SorCS2 [Ataeniobius toweri]|uniref:VPS10 domain-containing receptor SorCS2 n=1 Tax=Ataeniobius toweri TaxID=208326 RepID=A0ABU7AZE6_9TELE|nr:VPS10 domain-containing receptor SorCS2 [Ataeniobius toweri]
MILENVRSTKQPEENVLIDILEVRGVKGVFLANQKMDGKVTTRITYNKGRTWEPLTPPTTDMNGKPVSCKVVSTPFFIFKLTAKHRFTLNTDLDYPKLIEPYSEAP